MKLKLEIIRDVMLELEEKLLLNDNLESNAVSLQELKELLPSYSKEDLAYTIIKLCEANYIEAHIEHGGNKIIFCDVSDITYDGHEFINSIRDKGVWNDVKNAFNKVGVISLPIAKDIASSLLKQMLSNLIFNQ